MGKGGNGDTKTTVEPPKFLVPHIKDAAQEATNQFQQGPFSFFPGQTFAGFNPLQQQAQEQQLGVAGNIAPQVGAIGQANLQALQGADVLNDPTVQAQLGAIESRANRNLMENILPNVRRSATGVGQTFGSTESDQAQAMRIGDIQGRISEAQASLLGQARGQGLEAQGRALALAPQTLNTSLFPSQITGNVGAQRQLLEQAGIDEAMNRFNFEQGAPQQGLNSYINQLTGLQGNSARSTSEGQDGNSFLNILGGGLTGAALGSAIPGFGAGAAGATGLAAFGPAGIGLGALGALGGAGLFG